MLVFIPNTTGTDAIYRDHENPGASDDDNDDDDEDDDDDNDVEDDDAGVELSACVGTASAEDDDSDGETGEAKTSFMEEKSVGKKLMSVCSGEAASSFAGKG